MPPALVDDTAIERTKRDGGKRPWPVSAYPAVATEICALWRCYYQDETPTIHPFQLMDLVLARHTLDMGVLTPLRHCLEIPLCDGHS